MRITFVLPSASLSGGIRVVAIYAQRLQERGHLVNVISVPQRSIQLREKVKSFLKGQGWPGNPQRVSGHFDGLKVPHIVLEHWRPVVDADVPEADVVVATWWETAEWVAALSSAKGAKAYFIQHDERVMTWEPVKPRVAATWHLPMHKITIAQWLIDLAREEFDDHDVSLVPNSVDTSQFHAPIRGKQPQPTAGLMYSNTAFKGCAMSIDALRQARAERPDLRVMAFGAHKPSDSLPLPEGTDFHLQPRQLDIKMIYASCDLWLFGSRCEGFGLPILEAMACRTPVIGTPTGAAPELLAGGGGIMVKPEDSRSMADAIIHVARMPDAQWRAMSDAAYATATRYTWDDATVLFEKALEHAVARIWQDEIAGGRRN